MVSFLGSQPGRTIVIDLKRDELLLESIEAVLKKYDIENAVVSSAIGSLQKAVFHRVTGMEKEPVDEFVTVEKPLELASLQGFILNGHPHIHMVTSDLEQTYTGHLENGTKVLYLVEICLTELTGYDLVRVKDENNIAILKENN